MDRMLDAFLQVRGLSHQEGEEEVQGELMSMNEVQEVAPFSDMVTGYIFANRILHQYLSTHRVDIKND